MNKKVFYKILIHGFLIAMAVITLTPFIWLLLSSFKSNIEILAPNQTLFPKEFIVANYDKVNTQFNFMRYFTNSVFVVGIITVMTSYTSAITGFVLSKYNFKLKKLAFGIVMATMMLPWCVTIIPRYFIIKEIGWLNSYKALILPAMFSGFGIFMMKQNMESLPNEFLEAARIDGANEFFIFHRIVMPMSKNGVFAIAIFQFLWAWEDYLWPYLVITKPEKQLIAVGLKLFNGQYQTDYGSLFAATVISIIPVIVVYLLLQKRFVEGIASSGLKG